jgi:hypothetical protein
MTRCGHSKASDRRWGWSSGAGTPDRQLVVLIRCGAQQTYCSIVMATLARTMVAFSGDERFRVNVWEPAKLQLLRSTRTTLVVSPGA